MFRCNPRVPIGCGWAQLTQVSWRGVIGKKSPHQSTSNVVFQLQWSHILPWKFYARSMPGYWRGGMSQQEEAREKT